ncbi:YciI family protein [Neptunicella sp.]|uniref:YciI family protein n=1 Tax=Neptunicella sp. TaxID=2125986 RepID=UPI003F68CA5B
MRKLILLLATVVFSFNTLAVSQQQSIESDYDAELAMRLGADQYGMKSYVMVILTTGSMDDKITDETQRQQLFAGHFANMKRLADAGKLALAGPFIESRPKRGLLILNTSDLKAAEQLVRTDPAVQAGIFEFELSKYYGSAALMEINNLHKRIQKTQIE